MTHAELVERAVRWLRGTQQCGLVLSEFVAGGCREVPDAIGWKYGGRWSVLVECKTSVNDFYAEAGKPGRRSEDLYGGIGRERYYMAEKGVLDAERVRKNRPGWGLLEIAGKRVRVTLKAIPFDYRCLTREVPLLYSYLRRHQIRIKEQPDALCAVELGSRKKLSKARESLSRLLDIVNGDEMKAAWSTAFRHGFVADKKAARRDRAVIKEALYEDGKRTTNMGDLGCHTVWGHRRLFCIPGERAGSATGARAVRT